MLPPDAKSIVEFIASNYDYSHADIARLLGVSSRTVARILKGKKILPGTEAHLIRLYFSLVYLTDH